MGPLRTQALAKWRKQMADAVESVSKLQIIRRALLKYKLYTLGFGLMLVGIGLSIASFLSRYHDYAEVIRLPGLHLATAGLVLILVEYLVRGDTTDTLRELLDATLARRTTEDESRFLNSVSVAVSTAVAATPRDYLSSIQPSEAIRSALDAAREEIVVLGLSLRNFLHQDIQRQVKDALRSRKLTIRILMVDPGSRFVQWRERMWFQERGNITLHYRTEIELSKSILQDLVASSKDGPGQIEVRTYDLMPSCFFLCFDGRYFVSSYLTNRSVSSTPFIQLDGTRDHHVVAAYRDNFEQIWTHRDTRALPQIRRERGRRFVVVIAVTPNGVTFVLNRVRKLELPAGFIEPGESPEDAGEREFREEVGALFHVQDVIDREHSCLVFGMRGDVIGAPRASEIAEAREFERCPQIEDLSFYEPEDLLIIETAFVYQRSKYPKPLERQSQRTPHDTPDR